MRRLSDLRVRVRFNAIVSNGVRYTNRSDCIECKIVNYLGYLNILQCFTEPSYGTIL